MGSFRIVQHLIALGVEEEAQTSFLVSRTIACERGAFLSSVDRVWELFIMLIRCCWRWFESLVGLHGPCSTSQRSMSRPLLQSIRETFFAFLRFLFKEAFPLGKAVHFGEVPERLLLFLIVLYFSDFAFGFQAPSSWALLVPGFLQFSHGGPRFPRVPGDRHHCRHGVRRTQFLAWLVVGQQMYRIMPPAGAIIPAPEGWSSGRHTHVCRASFQARVGILQ